MYRKSKVFIIVIVFILQMVMFSELFVSTTYAALGTIAQDNFSTGNLTGGSGWSGSWTTSGSTAIVGNNYNSSNYCARLVSGNGVLTRTVDLSRWSNPTLTYYWKARSFELFEYAYVIVDDGTGEDTVHTINLLDADNVYSKETIDLSSYNMTSNFKIKFVSSMNQASDYFYVDDVVITGYSDDYGSSIATAEQITVSSETSGEIDYANDYDYFKFTTGEAGIYNMATTGSTNTYGYLYNASGTLISENDNKDSSLDTNFYIMEKLSANSTYYVGVKNYSATETGQYVLKVDGPKTALFFDGFESGNITDGGWVNSSAVISSSYKYNGTYSSQLNSSDSITKSISTEGYESIVISYARRSVNCESSDKLICAWSLDGTVWNTLESMSGTNDWGFRSYDLPAAANNNPNFRIRFYTSGNTYYDYAYVDNVLISGTMTPIPEVYYYEAETASLSGPVVASNHTGYTGTGFADYINLTGDYVQWTVDMAKAGIYLVEFKYSNGSTDLRPLDIIVNGQVATSSLGFPSTGAWDAWSYVGTNVTLNSGNNTIKALVTGSSGANIDHMKITLVQEFTPTPTPTPTPTVTPTEIIGDLKIEFYNSNRSSSTNTLNQDYRVTNIGSSIIDLSTVKLRYYYTTDSEISQNFYCDWSTVGSGNVTATFVKYDIPHNNADYYLEIGFTSGAGNLASGSSIEVKSRIAKTDWSNYTQTNDYSFNDSAKKYVEWNYVTAYISGNLVWGIPPDEVTPTPTPVATPTPTSTSAIGDLKVEFYNSRRDSSINTIYQNYRVTNIGSSSLDLSTVKLRYYYTIDVEKSQNFYCDWSTVGSGNITGTFIKYDVPYLEADYYLEISFTSGAGYLASGSSIEVISRIAKTDWSNYTQTNDYSFNELASNYVEWNYVTAYLSGTLVWGIPPEGVTPTPTATPTITPTATPIPTATRTPGPSMTPGIGNGLRGEYYDNMDFTDIKLIRVDTEINFEWGEGSPDSIMDGDTFSVIWLGKVQPLYSELYTFYTYTDEGVRLWVDDVLLVDNMAKDIPSEDFRAIDLDAGVKYDIRIEYCENSLDSVVKLMWSSNSQEKEVIPQTQLYPPRIFNALEHTVRTGNNNFAIGDYVPLMLEMQILWPIDNPVVSLDMNIRKQDGSASGFVLKEIMVGSNINKNMFKVYVNGVVIAQTNFSVWTEGSETYKKLKIRVLKSFTQNDVVKIYYTAKATATNAVFDTGIGEYIEANGLTDVNMNIFYEISERTDLGLVLTDSYSMNSTLDSSEKLQFQADIKLEDPILLE